MLNIADAVESLQNVKGLSDELIKKAVEEAMIAAYKASHKQADNVTAEFNFDTGEVVVHARKVVVNQVYDQAREMSIELAHQMNPEIEEGDEVIWK